MNQDEPSHLEGTTKVRGEEENAEESEPGRSHTSGNGSGIATASESQSVAIERSASGEPGASEGSQSLPARTATGPRTPEGKQRSKHNALKHGIFSGSVLLKGESRAEYNSLLDGLVEALAPAGKLEEVLVEKLARTLWRYRRLIQAEVAEIRKGIDFMQWEQQTREQKEVQEIDRSSALSYQGGLISRMDNPHVLKRCLDFLVVLRKRFAENGFTEGDTPILQMLYGDAHRSNLGNSLHKIYLIWLKNAEASEEDRSEHGYASPEQCKTYVLEAIDEEIRRLKKHQKARAAIESERMKVEAVRRVVPESPALDRLLRYEASLERSFDRTLSQLERIQRMRLGQAVPPPINVSVSSS